MNSIFKLLGICFVLSLLALPLAGCDELPWDAGMTLSLKVDTPKDGTTVTTSPVTVSGRVLGSQSAAARLTINNAAVPIKEKKYSTRVTLTEGTNVIDVVATSGPAGINKKVSVTYAAAK